MRCVNHKQFGCELAVEGHAGGGVGILEEGERVISRNFLVARSVTPINGMDGAMGRPLGRHALGYRYIGTCIHGLFSGGPANCLVSYKYLSRGLFR